MVQGKRSRKRKQRSKRNIFINIVATLLIIVALGLIFNAQIRNMIMVWHTNQYQVNKVSKDSINKNKNVETSFDFNKVESLSTEAVINAQWKAQQETQQMGQGNYALASHHVFGITGASNMLFSPLDRAKAGMKIYITDKEQVYTYVITSVETVTPDRTDLIEDTEGVTEITLVTCEDAAATNRTIVKGTLEGSVEYDKAPKEVLESFSKSYNQMQI